MLLQNLKDKAWLMIIVYNDECCATDGWVNRFKNQHDLPAQRRTMTQNYLETSGRSLTASIALFMTSEKPLDMNR